MLLLLVSGITLAYFWVDYSDRIDRKLLSGEIFTPTAGIYSAPKYLHAGDKASLADLIDYLKSAGYIEKNNKADQSRSRYSVQEGRFLIEPGLTGIINGHKEFDPLQVKFS